MTDIAAMLVVVLLLVAVPLTALAESNSIDPIPEPPTVESSIPDIGQATGLEEVAEPAGLTYHLFLPQMNTGELQ